MSIIGQLINAPIQGENLTVNSKNYAWHRPPKYSDFDSAFAYCVDEVIVNEARLTSGIALVMGGVSATAAISTVLLTMVKDGNISPDMSLLLAGPLFKVFSKTLDLAGVKYLSGFESVENTASFYEKLQSQDSSPLKKVPLPKEVTEETQDIAEKIEDSSNVPVGGLMGKQPTEETFVEMDIDSGTTNLLEQDS
jgi:hypothetical protein